MTDTLQHRGPDAEGVFVSGPVGLGHRRLSIIDLSPAGNQPLSNPDNSLWITYNGELYNFRDVRTELEKKRYQFRSQTDTEVIVQAYAEWGFDCLQYFAGMFAFGLWDEREKRLWLVRDRIGIKPLFYARLEDCLLFASEIKAILAHPSFSSRQLDYQALAYYLATNYMPAPYTLLSDVRQMLPGHYLVVSPDGQVDDVAYWDLQYQETSSSYNEQHYIDEFTDLLDTVVREHLTSDVPFGAFLSGGIDSSTVAYWMARNLNEPVKTFSIGFGETSFDELEYANAAARSIGTEHRERIVTTDTASLLPQLVWHAEEPTADSSMVAVYAVTELAREHVKMVHAGDGADEILAGYETYSAYFLHRLYRMLPGIMRRNLIEPLSRYLPVSDTKVNWSTKLRRFVYGGRFDSESAHALWRVIFPSETRAELLSPIWHETDVHADIVDLYRVAFSQTNASHPLNRLLYVDTRLYLPNDMLVKVDRMTMAHGLEARVPFLDHRLVEFAAALPTSLKLRNYRDGKYLLKAAMRNRLPDSIIHRKKAGFNVPNARWIKNDLRAFVTDWLAPSRINLMGFLDDAVVQRILRDHFEERAENSHQIWCLLTLSIWWDQFYLSRK